MREKQCWRKVARTFEEAKAMAGQAPRGGPMTPLVEELVIVVAKILVLVGFLLGLFSVMTYIERRFLAFMQFRLGPNRTGPWGILQPVADGIKLFFKEEFMPAQANKWLFLAAPAVAVVTALMAVAVVPYGGSVTIAGREITLQIADLDVGVLYLFAIASLGVYGVVLAGWACQQQVRAARRPALVGADVLLRAGAGHVVGEPDHGGRLVPDPGHRGDAGGGASGRGTRSSTFPPSSST